MPTMVEVRIHYFEVLDLNKAQILILALNRARRDYGLAVTIPKAIKKYSNIDMSRVSSRALNVIERRLESAFLRELHRVGVESVSTHKDVEDSTFVICLKLSDTKIKIVP